MWLGDARCGSENEGRRGKGEVKEEGDVEKSGREGEGGRKSFACLVYRARAQVQMLRGKHEYIGVPGPVALLLGRMGKHRHLGR